jgi:cell wall assembly regulator SMI1
MKALFDRLHHWLAAHAPAILADLRPPATLEQIGAAGKAMNLRLPDDLVAAYLIHDGQQTRDDGAFRPFLYCGEWLRLERMVEEWQIGMDLHDKDERYPYWRPHWIPLTFDGVGLLLYDNELDSVISPWEADNHGSISVCNYFSTFLDEFVNDLVAGRIEVNETPVVPIEVFEAWDRENRRCQPENCRSRQK